MTGKEKFMVWSMAFYFGWILSFPFFGAVGGAVAPALGVKPSHLWLSFMFLHATGFLAGALFLKKTSLWPILMRGSLVAVIVLSVLLWFMPQNYILALMAMIGFCSSFYILGWSCLIATYSSAEKVKLYLNYIIRANLITIVMIYLTTLLSSEVLFITKLILLIAALLVLIALMPPKNEAITWSKRPDYQPPQKLVSTLIIFFSLYYMAQSLAYTVIDNTYLVIAGNQFAVNYFWIMPYLAPYFLILNFRKDIRLKEIIYISIMLIGLAYILYISLGDTIAGFYLTTTMIKVGFALFHLFCWLLMGNLSTRFFSPFKYFGYGLFSLLIGSFLGGLLGSYLIDSIESPQLIAALSAITAIFLSIIFIPRLAEEGDLNDLEAVNISASFYHQRQTENTWRNSSERVA